MLTRTDCLLVLVVSLATFGLGPLVLHENKMVIYDDGDPITMWEDRLTSKANLHPLNRIDPSVTSMLGEPALTGLGEYVQAPVTFAESLMGVQLVMPQVDMLMRARETCQVTRYVKWKETERSGLRELIEQEYVRNLYLDGLPVVNKLTSTPSRSGQHSFGVPVGGYTEDGRPALYNFWVFKVRYHREVEGNQVIVGVSALPKSFASDPAAPASQWCSDRDARSPVYLDDDSVEGAYFGWSVEWELDTSVAWRKRVNELIANDGGDVEKFSALNSGVVALLLALTLLVLWKNAIAKEQGYQKLEEDGEGDEISVDRASEERAKWPALAGDVWRPPRYPIAFAALVGLGMQLMYAVLVTLALGMAGRLSAFSHGAVLSGVLLATLGTAMIGGLHAARTYQLAGGKSPGRMVVVSAVVPSMSMFFALVALVLVSGNWHARMVTLLFAYFAAVSLFSALGSMYGARTAGAYKYRWNVTVRAVPASHPSGWKRHWLVPRLAVGLLIFGTMMIQLYMLLRVAVFGTLYFAFGWMSISWVLLVAHTVLMSLMALVERLNGREDHRWWWGSLWETGCAGAFVLVYCFTFWSSQMSGGADVFFPAVLVLAGCIGLITGALGVVVNSVFMVRLYGKTD